MNAAELDALPAGTYVRDNGGIAWKKSGRMWLAGTYGMSSAVLARRGPHVIVMRGMS